MRRIVSLGALALGVLLAGVPIFNVSAEIVTRHVTYSLGDATMEGYLAYDDASTDKRPGILVIHQWMGLTEYEEMRARQLAGIGYVAFAADVYGKGVRPDSRQAAAAEAGKYYADRAMLRERLAAALSELRSVPEVDRERIAAIGYCFGGTCALELARSGADLAGVVSFHGGLGTPNPEDAANIKCPILACHGAADPHVPAVEVAAFEKEMTDAGVDWYLIAFGGAVHAFTQRAAGNDPSAGVAYNAAADRRSWEAMKSFFAELFD